MMSPRLQTHGSRSLITWTHAMSISQAIASRGRPNISLMMNGAAPTPSKAERSMMLAPFTRMGRGASCSRTSAPRTGASRRVDRRPDHPSTGASYPCPCPSPCPCWPCLFAPTGGSGAHLSWLRAVCSLGDVRALVVDLLELVRRSRALALYHSTYVSTASSGPSPTNIHAHLAAWAPSMTAMSDLETTPSPGPQQVRPLPGASSGRPWRRPTPFVRPTS